MAMVFIALGAYAQATDLFFSEYLEGSSNNKAIELFNGTGSEVDLSQYKVRLASNGGTWSSTNSITLTGTLANGDVYVISNAQANAAILAVADITHTVTYFNGNDALGLFRIEGGTDVLIDMIGVYQQDPGTAWPVAGVDGATLNHTLIRKPNIISGNLDFIAGAGTNQDNSEWIVQPQDYMSDIGMHTFNPGGQGAATPEFNPPGGVYSQPVTVTITSATAGAQIYYTTNGLTPDQSSTMYSTPVQISANTSLKAIAYAAGMDPSYVASANYMFPIVVNNIGELRSQPADASTIYFVSGEAILTFKQTFRNQKYVQDNTGAILIDDPSGVITTNYNVYDGITGLIGTLAPFNTMLQLTPTGNPGAATSSGNGIQVPVVTIQHLNDNFDYYQARVVKLNNVHFVGASGDFANGQNYTLQDPTGSILLRTRFYDVDYIGTPIPTGNFGVRVICYANFFSGAPENQVVPRFLSDFGAVSNEDDLSTPLTTQLIGNYPNPFNPSTTIRYSTAKAEPVQILIYNQKGQLVKTLEQTVPGKGIHEVQWNGTDDRGSSVSSGIYYFRLRSGKVSNTKKMILLK